ncbi:MAG: peptidoglycan bridge formation glycyltransferase FemA/FemB family protein [Chloroflexi bacterium]|nr:peptidoglycan bridge formation glycyltransferase FemA/FemB family protein [Chloroflexota bacterium]
MSDFLPLSAEERQWDAFVQAQGGHGLQTAAWGRLKASFGWESEILTLEADGEVVAGALVLYRPLPAGVGRIAYIPKGPLVDWQDAKQLEALLMKIDQQAKRRRALFLKIEPDEANSASLRAILAQQHFRESRQTIQPPNTILIDLDDDDSIMSRMNQGTRRKIRSSWKKDVMVREGSRDDVATFNRLIQETGERNEFGVHSTAYYERAYDLFVPDGQAVLLMAEHQGQALGGLMILRNQREAWYLYGASASIERQRMATYGLQWAAIQWARAQGCQVYDMWGIPDTDEESLERAFQDRQDGLWGVYGFKRGFGGRVQRAVGAWDRVYFGPGYLAYQLYLSLRGQGT